ncbi:sensor histidine kinase [Aquincola sp. J276]|uniref:sensor histidine kinase n=1 Tax=Aquincola sp. J276 TaxID=2898432 RepID=UPI002151D1E1|nr:sensor histidine kinase [Aquincola sp. J276]MCR5867574.1 sensor histidine kinase [Aquincola sp. J276]
MRRLWNTVRWSIAGRLITLALAPTMLMLVIVNGALYWQSLADASADAQDRGVLIARSLAEGSRYGVVSGNTFGIEQTVSGIFAADPSVVRIAVLDGQRRPSVLRQTRSQPADVLYVEVSITAEPLNVDTFDTAGRTSGQAHAGPLGYVQVSVSPTPLAAKRAQRLMIGGSLILGSGLVSVGLGLALARRLRDPLVSILASIRSIMAGRFELTTGGEAPGELGEVQRAVQAMAQALQLTQERLEGQVHARTVELRDAVERLKAADDEKRRLIASSNAMVEDERRRISLEIHDDLNAALVTIRMHAAGLASAVAARNADELVRTADRIVTLVDQTYGRARDIVRNLRPEILDALGLAGAAEEMVRHFDAPKGECRYSFKLTGPIPSLNEATAIAAYRILQEALSNVSKHAHATQCRVTISPLDVGGGIRLCIVDDGEGIEKAPAGTGLGLVGMRERLAALGGSLTISTGFGQGTTLEVVIPVGDETA